jgi:Pyruvate/2-oxoglutarate dehydrogenase complex, dihydrolipoamide acyltransferase (E2) component, and related enzymes
MPIQITMPALSPTMEEGTLSKWLVKEGDKISSGDVIAEIETDKATMEVEAVDEGTLARIVVPEGTQGVKVNSVIAILAAEGEDVAAAAGSADAATAAKAESAPKRAWKSRSRRRRKPLRLPPLPSSPRHSRPRRPNPALLPRVAACSLRRWRAALPAKRASTSPLSRVPARTGGS